MSVRTNRWVVAVAIIALAGLAPSTSASALTKVSSTASKAGTEQSSHVGPETSTLPIGVDAETQLLQMLNDYRFTNGMKALVRIPALDSFARDWSAFMASGGCVKRDGAPLCHRTNLAVIVSLVSPKGWTRAGENIGLVGEGRTIKELHAAFVASAAHRANMLNPLYNGVGVGVKFSEAGTLYVTFEFVATVGPPNSTGPIVGFPDPPQGASPEDAFLFYVNFLREQAGLHPVARQVVLDRESDFWSLQRVKGVCGEDTSLCNRRDMNAMIKASVGATATRWWAGMVGVTYATDASAQVAWFAGSAAMRKVLLRPDVNLIGIGIEQDSDGLNFITLSVLKVKNPLNTLPKSGNTCGWVQANLAVRSKGVAVRVAQCAVQLRGFWAGQIDGVFSTAFQKAVKAFQVSVKLRATGVLDLKTRRALGVI